MTILKWALIFLVVSIIAGLLGFTGVSIISADIARFLFYVFVAIFLVLLILGLTIFRVRGGPNGLFPSFAGGVSEQAIHLLRPWIASLTLAMKV